MDEERFVERRMGEHHETDSQYILDTITQLAEKGYNSIRVSRISGWNSDVARFGVVGVRLSDVKHFYEDATRYEGLELIADPFYGNYSPKEVGAVVHALTQKNTLAAKEVLCLTLPGQDKCAKYVILFKKNS